MTLRDLRRQRLRRQLLVAPPAKTVDEVVAALGAVQAQDYLGALWSIGQRTAHATEADVERAVAERRIVRSWPMRGTLHFVPAADLRWMLALLTPRIRAATAAREKRDHAIDEKVVARCHRVVARALRGGGRLTRDELQRVLDRNGIRTAGQRGYHLLWRLAQDGVICFGPRAGKQHTFVLVDEWLPAPAEARRCDRAAALAELARRYFRSYGPATAHDFAWWSGLTLADGRTAIEALGAELERDAIAKTDYWSHRDPPATARNSRSATVRLLSGFDEYLLGYTDRSAVLDAALVDRVQPANNGMFLSTIVCDGQIAGTWKRELRKDRVVLSASPFAPLAKKFAAPLRRAAERYGEFLGVPVAQGGAA